MAKAVLLNNIDHQDLRVLTTRGAAYGDDAIFAHTFPAEFRQLQAHYPIVFRRSPDGATFEAFALFGFETGENLFLGADGWQASYVPLAVERQPFLIGIGAGEPGLTVHVDLDSPRIGRTDGEAVFMPHGSPTPFLERMNSTLLALHQGMQAMPSFVAALLELDLLEAFVFDIELDDGSQNRMEGFYMINEEKLGALDGATLEGLSRAGYLQPIYMVIASLSNFRALIDRKNRLNAARH